MDITDMISAVLDISKVISKEESRARAKQSLIRVQKDVAIFSEEFDKILHVVLPNMCGPHGELFS